MTEFVWWESCITEHQVHTLIELSNLPETTVTVFSTRLENTTRKKQGWNECNWSLIDMNLIPSVGIFYIARELKKKGDCIHIFGGPFDSWKITLALFLCVFMGNRSYILTEPYSPVSSGLLENGNQLIGWLRHKIRPLKFRMLWALLRGKVEGVFAISSSAIDQLLAFGVRKEIIFPYAYFVPSTYNNGKIGSSVYKRAQSNEALNLIFVGSLNRTKGIDLLINAVNSLREAGVRIKLDVFGPRDGSEEYCWSSSVKYRGVIQSVEVQSIMAEYDFLVLPSRYDGWGVVVNEALLAGIPVICSDKVGASSLVKKWGCGVCYESAKDSALKECLLKICQNKKIIIANYKDSVAKVCHVISPKYGARYIDNCVRTRYDYGIVEENSWYN